MNLSPKALANEKAHCLQQAARLFPEAFATPEEEAAEYEAMYAREAAHYAHAVASGQV